MRDDDERLPDQGTGSRGTGGDPVSRAQWLDVVVPDDISALEPDIRAYHRELRSRRRRRHLDRVLATRGWQRFGLPGAIVAGVLLIALSVVIALTAIGSDSVPQRAASAPLATAPRADVGHVGGLLPDIRLASGVTDVAVRELRPAVLALLPARCDCLGLLDTVAGQAHEYHLDLLLVAGRGGPDVSHLASGVRRGPAVALGDGEGVLARTYDATGVTLLLVAPDGTVAEVLRDVRPDLRLEPQLSRLVEPQAAAVRAVRLGR